MIDQEKDKKVYEFLKNIENTRGHFKDGEWIGVANPKNIHIEGITRQQAELLYKEECKKRKKYTSLIGRLMGAITKSPQIVLDNCYKTILELMDILHQDFIDDKDLDKILVDVESFYNKHYNKTEVEGLNT